MAPTGTKGSPRGARQERGQTTIRPLRGLQVRERLRRRSGSRAGGKSGPMPLEDRRS